MAADIRHLVGQSGPTILWLTGLAIFIALFPFNNLLVNDAAPLGIASHRSATTPEMVEGIQRSWALGGQYSLAYGSLLLDYLFILAFSCGGLLMARTFFINADKGWIKSLAAGTVMTHIIFGFSDLAETSAQLVQLLSTQGNSTAIWLIHAVRPLTISAFLLSVASIISLLLVHWWHR